MCTFCGLDISLPRVARGLSEIRDGILILASNGATRQSTSNNARTSRTGLGPGPAASAAQ
eukprot:scaffold89081_cov69-Phaeocystis_antarctica.AAC.2